MNEHRRVQERRERRLGRGRVPRGGADGLPDAVGASVVGGSSGGFLRRRRGRGSSWRGGPGGLWGRGGGWLLLSLLLRADRRRRRREEGEGATEVRAGDRGVREGLAICMQKKLSPPPSLSFLVSPFPIRFALPSAASEVICRLQSSEPSALLPTTTSFPAAGVAILDRGEALMAKKRQCSKEEEERPPRGCCLCCLCGARGFDGFDEEATPPRGRAAMRVVGRSGGSNTNESKKQNERRKKKETVANFRRGSWKKKKASHSLPQFSRERLGRRARSLPLAEDTREHVASSASVSSSPRCSPV